VNAGATDAVKLVVAAYVAGRRIEIGEAERNAALRRALLVFAAGGDARREPTLDDPAVLELARDLDTPKRRSALAASLTVLDPDPVARTLLADPELAWIAFACGLLADAIGADGPEAAG
jgi:hypothetical protein